LYFGARCKFGDDRGDLRVEGRRGVDDDAV
jgi:hypothetical protein